MSLDDVGRLVPPPTRLLTGDEPIVTAKDHASYDPLDTEQWTWVVPRQVVEDTGQMSLALSRVEKLASGTVPYGGLANAVAAAARVQKA